MGNKEFKEKDDLIQDCIVFMSAYKLNDIAKQFRRFGRKRKVSELMKEYHISSMMNADKVITQRGVLKVTSSFDTYEQETKFKIETIDEEQTYEDYEDEVKKLGWGIRLANSTKILFDNEIFKTSFFINMESFLIDFEEKIFQVDPIVFFLNNIMFICFELIDGETGMPLNKNEVYGRDNNYNIRPITKLKYFNEASNSIERRKIPDIIFENIISMFEGVSRRKYQVEHMSYLHNIFVETSNISNIEEYFQCVLGDKEISIDIKNLNGNSAFQYYSQEYLGVVIPNSNENAEQALWDGQLLEAMKMFILLSQITTYDFTMDVQSTMNEQMYIERLVLMSRAPIITINAIKNMQETETFKRYKDSINFKIAYLNMIHERLKNRNALFLNILLYLLTFIGSIGTLQVFKEEFGWPFTISFSILFIIFIVLGVMWAYLEKRK